MILKLNSLPHFFAPSIHWKESRELTKMNGRVRECAP